MIILIISKFRWKWKSDTKKLINMKWMERKIYFRQSVDHLKPSGNYTYHILTKLKNIRDA